MADKEIIVKVGLDSGDAEKDLNNLKNKIGEVNNVNLDKPFKTIKQEIKEANNEAQRLAIQFGTNSKEFQNAAIKVAELKNELDDVNISVQNFNPDNKLRSFVTVGSGAIGTLQGMTGAMTLFGVESEDAQKSIAKLQALMAIGDALDRIEDMKDGFKTLSGLIQSNTAFQKVNNASTAAASNLMKLFGVSVNSTSIAFKALKGAIIATGIGALIIAISALIPKITNWISGTDKAEEAQNRLNSSLEKQKDLLNSEMKSIDYATKSRIARAKIAGQSEADIKKIESEASKDRLAALENNYKRLQSIASDDKDRSFEDQKKANQESIDAYREYLSALADFDLKKLEDDAENAEKARKEQKDKDEKRKQAYQKEIDEAKTKKDELKRIRDEELKQIKDYEDDAKKNNADSFRTDRQKELNDLKIDFDAKVALFKKHGKDVTEITTEYNREKGIIQKKYDDEALKVLNDVGKSEFDKQREEINKKYNDLIANTENQITKLKLLTAQALELNNVNTTETNEKNSINKETTLIEVQTENQIEEEDTPKTKLAKLKAIYDAERIFKEAKFQEELAKLGNDEAAINNLKAKYNQEALDDKKEFADAEKAIDDSKRDALIGNINQWLNASQAVTDIIGKDTVAGKAIAVAKATIDTYQGIAAGVKLGFPAAIPAVAMATATGFSAVKNILKVKVPAKGGDSSGGSAPSLSAPQIQSTQIPNEIANKIQDVRITNPQNQPVKAYIVDRELTEHQNSQEFLNKLSSL